MEILLATAAFVIGAIIGSFLNVVILRFRTGKSVGGRSQCMSCSKVLRWFELIPVLSYLAQRGRCRRCASRVSVQYPIIEVLTGILFSCLALYVLPIMAVAPAVGVLEVLFGATAIALLVVIAAYDWRHKIIPNELVYTFIGISFVSQFVVGIGADIFITLPSLLTIFSGVILALPFAILWLLSSGKLMGFGDVKLMIGMGYFLGLLSGVAAVMIAFWVGALYAIVLLIHNRLLPVHTHRITMKSEVPFGPFLILAFFVAYFLGLDIVSLTELLTVI